MGRNSLEKILQAYLEDVLWHTEEIADTKGLYASTTEQINQYYKSSEKDRVRRVHFKAIYENILSNIEILRNFKTKLVQSENNLEKYTAKCHHLEMLVQRIRESNDYYKEKCKTVLAQKYGLDNECKGLKSKLGDEQSRRNTGENTNPTNNETERHGTIEQFGKIVNLQNRRIEELTQRCQNVREDILKLRQTYENNAAKIIPADTQKGKKVNKLSRHRNTLNLNIIPDDESSNHRKTIYADNKVQKILERNMQLEDEFRNMQAERDKVDLENQKLQNKTARIEEQYQNEERERKNLQQEIEDCEEELRVWEKRFKDLTKQYDELSNNLKIEQDMHRSTIKQSKQKEEQSNKHIQELKVMCHVSHKETENLRDRYRKILDEKDKIIASYESLQKRYVDLEKLLNNHGKFSQHEPNHPDQFLSTSAKHVLNQDASEKAENETKAMYVPALKEDDINFKQQIQGTENERSVVFPEMFDSKGSERNERQSIYVTKLLEDFKNIRQDVEVLKNMCQNIQTEKNNILLQYEIIERKYISLTSYIRRCHDARLLLEYDSSSPDLERPDSAYKQSKEDLTDNLDELQSENIKLKIKLKCTTLPFINDIVSVHIALNQIDELLAKENRINLNQSKSDLKKEMMLKYGKNIQHLVTENKKLSKSQLSSSSKDKHQEFKSKLNVIKKDIKHLEDEYDEKKFSEDITQNKFVELKVQFDTEICDSLYKTQRLMQKFLSHSLMTDKLNQKYQELVFTLKEENERLQSNLNEPSNLTTKLTEQPNIHFEHEEEINVVSSQETDGKEDTAQGNETANDQPGNLHVADSLSQLSEISKSIQNLEKMVDDFSGTKENKMYLNANHALLDNIAKINLIEEKEFEIIRKMKIRAIKFAIKCIQKLENKVSN